MEAKQLKLTFLLTMLMSMVGAKAFAHDIVVANADGKPIYYTYYYSTMNGKKVLAVSYRGSRYDSYSNEYSGVVNIPESVTYGGTYPVTSIEWAAFYGCTGLTSVTIPNSVTSIGSSAFYGCTGLTSVTIPNSVTSIGTAFVGCSGLTEINVDENNSVYSSIDGVVLNKSQTELVCYPGGKQGAYTIPNSVTSIGRYAFQECRGLTSIDIPNSVTSIGDYAFSDCTGLTSVTIPNSVTSIGSSAFYYCSGLTDIYCHIEEPLTIDSYVFNIVPKNTCTLHVPIGSKVKYEAADVWKSFLNIVEDLPTGIVSIDNSQSTIDNDVWFTLNGVRLNGKPTIPGIYIVNGLKVVIK